jgi:flagellar motor protein MotB
MRLALPSAKPLWLITLADLSLLLVGFFVFLQATSHKPQPEQEAIQAGIRQAFGGVGAAPLAVEANAITGFNSGSAALPRDRAAIAAWVTDALADQRTRLIVTGYADGSPGDRANGSAMALAGRRAEAAAAALGGTVSPDRLRLAAAILPGARRVTLVISYDP